MTSYCGVTSADGLTRYTVHPVRESGISAACTDAESESKSTASSLEPVAMVSQAKRVSGPSSGQDQDSVARCR